jgi:hypothetical protein
MGGDSLYLCVVATFKACEIRWFSGCVCVCACVCVCVGGGGGGTVCAVCGREIAISVPFECTALRRIRHHVRPVGWVWSRRCGRTEVNSFVNDVHEYTVVRVLERVVAEALTIVHKHDPVVCVVGDFNHVTRDLRRDDVGSWVVHVVPGGVRACVCKHEGEGEHLIS